MKFQPKQYLLLLFCYWAYQAHSQVQQTNTINSDSLWEQYKNNPENHSNIPNCSFAGYRGTECNSQIPNPQVQILNVKSAPFNANGNGQGNDGPAIQAAIDSAGLAGGGIVFIPNGTYKIDTFLRLRHNRVIIRGQSRDGTILDFPRSLQNQYGRFGNGTNYYWWWAGGLIWMGPDDTFDAAGRVFRTDSTVQGWEVWRPDNTIAEVISANVRGDKTITLTSNAGIQPGSKILLVWQNPADKSLLKHIYGHEATSSNLDVSTGPTGNCGGVLPPAATDFTWPVEVESVLGNSLIGLAQPLRIDIKPEWNVVVKSTGSILEESGIENLRIKCYAQATHNHLEKPGLTKGGWNGVYVNRAWNCWIKNVAVSSAENPFILSSCKHVSVLKTLINGSEQNHHSYACRVSSHDNLFEEFEVNGPMRVKHGINTEGFSSGNVWSKGLQKSGTFDTHRAIPFDFIRTECTVANDGGSGPGGGSSAGPFTGRRASMWNVNVQIDPNYSLLTATSNGGLYINQPFQFVMGTLAGIRGVPVNTSQGWAMPIGEKGTLVVDGGLVPNVVNLFEAQKILRCNTSSLPEKLFVKQELEVKVWPNPASERLYFSVPEKANGVVEIAILNALGQIVTVLRRTDLKMENGENYIPVKRLPKGIYQVSVKTESQVFTLKFLKAN